ncbi:hypothetical protein CVIRNUC_003429 [Coccomyxa viridis]|uniref:Uncharacterized protein n=1 Tax=Coccomyxa viridis TaxID=1274662 RepID=A0AAV1HYK2_9CHLO|nr:hypothetical protein CVIRNUC_003429 [Coccomyxa viridis]
MRIQRAVDLRPESITFKSPQKTADNNYRSATCLEDGSMVILQMPPMKLDAYNLDPDSGRLFVDFKLTNNELYQVLRRVDSHTIQTVFNNRMSWFSVGDVSMASVEDSYSSPIIKGADAPLVRFRPNAVETAFFVNKSLSDAQCMEGCPMATAIVQLRGLTLFKDSMSPEWVLHSLKVTKATTTEQFEFSEL